MMHLDFGAEESAPRRLLGRVSLAGVGSVCQQGLYVITGLVTARVLGAAGYGLFNLARNLLEVALVFTRLGLDLGLQRYFGEANGVIARAARLQVLRRVRLVAAVAALLPLVAVALGLGHWLESHVYRYADFGRILLCLALALPFATDMVVLSSAYRGVLKLGPAVLAENLLLPLARLLCILLLFALGWRIWAVAVGTTAGAVVASGWLALRARRDFAAVPAPAPGAWRDARRVIGYSSVLGMAVLVTTLSYGMDILMLGHFASAAELGQYALAKQLLMLTSVVAVAFSQGMGGLIADRYFRGDHAGVLRVLSQAFRWIALATLPVFVIFWLWGAELLPLFGISFTISPAVVAWLAAAQFIVALFGPMGWALSMTGRHLQELAILVAGLLCATVLCAFAIPAWGQLGAAMATCIAIACVNVLRMICVRRAFGALPFEAGTWLLLAGGLVLGLGIRLLLARLPLSGPGQAALGSLCFLACYGALCSSALRDAFSMIKRPAVGHG